MVLLSPSRPLTRMFPRLRDDVDIDQVPADVLGVVDQTFHPANAGMSIRGLSR